MVSQVTKVINKEGFHMRPANMFVKEMTAFQSDVHLILNGKDINACLLYTSPSPRDRG